MPVAELIRRVGVSEQTFYRWKKVYSGMESDQVRELKQLQDENTRLKKLVADLSLDKAILQDINSKNGPARVEASSSELHRKPLRDRASAGLSDREATSQCELLSFTPGS